jgi:AcrR family transcriptional regulator
MESSEPPRRGRPRSFDRQQALCAALRLFREHGYEGTSLAELQQALGLSPPSIYAAFGNKEQLFKEATDHYVATLRSVAERAMADAVTTKAAIEATLRSAVVASTEPGEPRGCLLVQGAITCSASSESVQQHLHDLRKESYRAILKRLKVGVASGELPAGIDAPAMAQFYTTFAHGISIQARDGASRPALMAAVQCAMAAWDSLVGGEGVDS